MTKADILKILERVPMNAEVLFVDPFRGPAGHGWDREHELKEAYTVTGRDGPCVLLTSGGAPREYEDLETLR